MELVLNSFGSFLGKKGERLVVKRRDQDPVEIPAEHVSDILVTTQGASLSSDAIRLAMAHQVNITFLSPSGEPYAKVVPPDSFKRAALRRQQLLAADDERGVALVKAFLRGKLRNQASTLRYFAKSRKDAAPDLYGDLHDRARRIEAVGKAAVIVL